MDQRWTTPRAVFADAQVMRQALEQIAEQGNPIAIKALVQVDGHSPYLAQVRGLWQAQGVYGHHREPDRHERRHVELAEPVDPAYEREARKEALWALRECWRTIWAEFGAPITVVRLHGAGNDRRAA